MSGYTELHVSSNFSFLRGASHPEELVETAARLGHAAIAIADRNSLAGVVRAHIAARAHGIKLIVGACLDLEDGTRLICLPTDRQAYSRLSRMLSVGKRRAAKGECLLTRQDVIEYGEGQLFLLLPPERLPDDYAAELRFWVEAFPAACHLAACMLYYGNDARRLKALITIAAEAGLPLAATNDVHYHLPERRPLQDVLTCIREHCRIDDAGWRLDANAERYLKPPGEMARLFRDWPEAIAETIRIADRCRFSLDELAYEYPDEIAPNGRPVQEELEARTFAGAAERYPDGIPQSVQTQLRHELDLIARLDYAPYFLTVYDVVRFARSEHILCQGRGSAANSAVCYCLGITSVDPSRTDLLFERFVSEARGEPPDIDVDFEHERREEVIQYIYRKYGRERAGLAATVISYRSRSALRDVGKAMGLSEDVVGLLSSQVWGRHGDAVEDERIREVGLDPADRRLTMAMNLTRQLIGFPRHLSQHVGGFVITRGRLDELVPIENAAMADRTVIEWDKDDLDALGMLKIDILALGMLSCVRKAFALLERHYGLDYDLASVPAEDPKVYDMLSRGDSLGVFQVESRAQMAMLPRLRPRNFYDLVIEVAIVRPGPIQGDMVHPYLRRRDGIEPVEFPSEELRGVLGKTLGVPLFQEQAMKIAIVAAGFTPSEADQLRRAMATFKKTGQIGQFRNKMIEGMVERKYERDFAERCFRQIEGFGNYGFPESHAASFALLVYVSSWFKCRYPAIFAAALLNSQPMGFYAPAQIVRDAREHGVTVLPPDVNHSGWDCDLEPDGTGRFALRLGLRQIKGIREGDAEMIAACRGQGYRDPGELWRRAGITPAVLEMLARGDAFASMGLARREVFWAVRGLARAVTGPVRSDRDPGGLPLFLAAEVREQAHITLQEAAVHLPEAPMGEQVVEDYAALHLSLKAHPVGLLRPSLDGDGCIRCEDLDRTRDGRRVRLGGLVLVRQRPGTAKGIIFITLEDESSVANLIVWPDRFEQFRRIVLGAKFLGVTGLVQREGRVIHVVVEKLEDLTYRLGWLTDGTVDEAGFNGAIANADEVSRPQDDYREKPPRPKLPLHPAPNPDQIRPSKPLHTHPRNMKPDLKVVSRNFH